MSRRILISVLVVIATIACNQGPSIPQAPQIKTDRDSLGFGLEFGTATYIGTSITNSLLIENTGSEDLIISSVDFTNDGNAFSAPTFSTTTVKYSKSSVLQEFFAPTQARDYSGKIVIHSNAANEPVKVITLSGKGVVPPPDAGS